MQLTLVISSLSSGGAERVMSIMANYWAAKGWKIAILTFDDGTVAPFYYLDSRVFHLPLGIAENSPNQLMGFCNNLKRMQTLRKAISDRKPDVVISFMDKTNVLTLLATPGLKVPVVVSERSDPRMQTMGQIWEQLRWWSYRMATSIVVQSKGVLDYFNHKIKSSIYIIPNPVLSAIAIPPKKCKFTAKISLIAMGRLSEEKRFNILLQAFAKMKDIYPHSMLTIIGEGYLRSELELWRDRLELTDRVYLPGRVKNPYEYLKQADIFVMSSHYEGFPNALCEAMACGLPVISTDCPSGPREIIRDGIDGILVPNGDVDALAMAMERLISDEAERKRLAARAPEVTERFSLEKVMVMWEKLLEKVVNGKL